jgi:hypothetical protein
MLSAKQKRYLAELAERAFVATGGLKRWQEAEFWSALYLRAGLAAEGAPACVSAAKKRWRHLQVAIACGKLGLRCCVQDDFNRVEARLLDLVGEPGRALNAHVRAETEPARVAEWKLVEACKRFGYPLTYAEAICRRRFGGAGLFEIGPKQIWQLVFTINNNGRKARKLEAHD